MNVLIVEDEQPAIDKLERYLLKYNPEINVLERLKSVSDTVAWFKANQKWPDLLFLDIQLLDGLSFEIFHEVNVRLPMIFTTAFDEYALDAFKHHSIDYLLKPVTFTDLSRALKKFEDIKQWSDAPNVNGVIQQISAPTYKDRFMVKQGQHIHTISSDAVQLFLADGRTVYLMTSEGKKYIIDYKLEDLEQLMDPRQFFRVNRTYFIHIDSVKDVLVYSNSRLKIATTLSLDKEIIVSREKVTAFKKWLEGDH